MKTKTQPCKNCEIVFIHGIAREINYCYLHDAAPELLEVAKEAESLISYAADNSIDPLVMFATLERIKHVIAKAEGKQ